MIGAEGEQKAARALKEASDIISESPAALQLRYLQTLATIATEKNSTIIFPLPIDLLQSFMKWFVNDFKWNNINLIFYEEILGNCDFNFSFYEMILFSTIKKTS